MHVGSQHVRTVMNSISIGQETAPIIASIGEPLKEKSGNLQGFTCYQYAAVYSATEDAVIVSKNGRVVFFGNSTCRVEMQGANFKDNGKYASEAAPAATVNTGADSNTGAGSSASPPAAGSDSHSGPATDSSGSSQESQSGPASGAAGGSTSSPAPSSNSGGSPSNSGPAQAPASAPK